MSAIAAHEAFEGHDTVVVHWMPEGEPRACLLVVPAFGDEMNQTRRMIRLAAEALAAQGIHCCSVDLKGTGDSSADFNAATLQAWLADLHLAATRLRARVKDVPLLLLGVRLGFALACRLTQEHPGLVQGVLGWAPVLRGKSQLSTMLRADALARGTRTDGASHAEPRQLWREKKDAVLGGYPVSATLAHELEALEAGTPAVSHVAIADLRLGAPGESSTLTAAVATLSAQWSSAGLSVDARPLAGPAFWNVVDLIDVPELIDWSVDAATRQLDALADSAKRTELRSPPSTAASLPQEPGQADARRWQESVLRFGPAGEERVGILVQPRKPVEGSDATDIGIVIVTGGPQTRVGSHRQFTELGRALAQAGLSALRFDYAGMGDSTGPMPHFEHAGADIDLAVQGLRRAVPGCRRVVVWGLCDGATAALFRAVQHPDIVGVCAANPWARSAATQSAALVRDHYGGRLKSWDFWKRLLSGKIDVWPALREAAGHVVGSRRQATTASDATAGKPVSAGELPDRLSAAMAALRVPLRVQISGRDLTAAEFELAMQSRPHSGYRPELAFRQPQADHTFSDPEAMATVAQDLIAFVRAVDVQSLMSVVSPDVQDGKHRNALN